MSLKKLQLSYVDLYLIHFPVALKVSRNCFTLVIDLRIEAENRGDVVCGNEKKHTWCFEEPPPFFCDHPHLSLLFQPHGGESSPVSTSLLYLQGPMLLDLNPVAARVWGPSPRGSLRWRTFKEGKTAPSCRHVTPSCDLIQESRTEGLAKPWLPPELPWGGVPGVPGCPRHRQYLSKLQS